MRRAMNSSGTARVSVYAQKEIPLGATNMPWDMFHRYVETCPNISDSSSNYISSILTKCFFSRQHTLSTAP